MKKHILWTAGILALGFSILSCKSSTPARATAPAEGVSITYLGHACFLIAAKGVSIVTDPYAKLDYPALNVRADVVTVSHEHFDHNNVDAVSGSPTVIRGLTPDGADWEKVDRTVKGARFRVVPVYHDPDQGTKRGNNTVFVITVGGLRIVHLGDLGTELTAEQIKAIGPVDVLLAPVGGFYTIDAAAAARVVARLKPRVVIPMHYKTAATAKLPISDEKDFLKRFPSARKKGHVLELSAASLPRETTVYLMRYK